MARSTVPGLPKRASPVAGHLVAADDQGVGNCRRRRGLFDGQAFGGGPWRFAGSGTFVDVGAGDFEGRPKRWRSSRR